MESSVYGNTYGQLVVYFHGAPGDINESSLFDEHAKKYNLKILCFNRFLVQSKEPHADYFHKLAEEIKSQADGKPVDIIGFSIGTYIALKVCELISDQIRNVHLISAVAPLGDGKLLDDMAGGLVFKLALKKPTVFSLLTKIQKCIALIMPNFLVRTLFASAAGKDKKLAEDTHFLSYITPIVRRCFLENTPGYIRDIALYVKWSGEMYQDIGGVKLWHGTEDNWSPLAMSIYLKNKIVGAELNAMPGLSHYSCLIEAAPKICAELAISPK